MRENNSTAEDFLAKLALSLQDFSESIQLCREHQKTQDSETNVLSTCLLEVLMEVESYLDYFEEEIERKFGVSVLLERKRIQEEIFAHFVQDISGRCDPYTYLGRLRLVDRVISRWAQFTREDAETILRA